MSRLSHWYRWSLEWDVQNIRELIENISPARVPRIYASNSPIGELARSALDQTYWPLPLLGPSLQFILSCELQRFCVRHKYRREELSLDDGGLIGLDWFKWSQCRALPQTAPILLVLHFITGHSKQGPILSLCQAAFQQGWRPVAMNYRGCGGLELKSSRVYSAADTPDLHAAILHISHLYPSAPIMLAGFSLGAMLVTKYLAELPPEPKQAVNRIVAAAAASSPFDLGSAWKRMAAPSILSPLFWTQYVSVLRWIHYAWRHWQILSKVEGMQWSSIWTCASMVDIDSEITCKVLGYKHADDYYTDISSFQYIPKIRVPCLFTAALDDPFVRELPIEECRSNSQTVLAVTDCGGHCAHLQGFLPIGRTFLDDMIVSFLQAILRESRGGS